MYQKYKSHPEDVDFSWQKFFEGFDFSSQSSIGNNLSNDETNVNNLINAYRIFGHLNSNTNPVRVRRDHNVKFDLEFFNLNKSHLEKEFNISSEIGLDNLKIRMQPGIKVENEKQFIYNTKDKKANTQSLHSNGRRNSFVR